MVQLAKRISQLTADPQPSTTAILPMVDGSTTVSTTTRAITGRINVKEYGVLTTNTGAVNDPLIVAAVAAAASGGAELFWPEGSYPTAASIALLHTVRHRGPGALIRGSDTFYLEPKSGQTNRLYMATTGSSANDGLTASQPMNSLATVFAAMANYGPMLEGTWRCPIAAGNHTADRNSNHYTPSRNPIIVEGPSVGGSPNTPTVVFDGNGAAANSYAFRCSGPGTQIDLRNVRFDDWTGGVGIGFLADSDCGYALLTNVHCVSCDYGVYGENCRNLRTIGGLYLTCTFGLLANAVSYVGTGYTGDITYFDTCDFGITWSRGTQGHCDYSRFDDCGIALDIFHDARAHVMASNFVRSDVAIRARTGGYWYDEQDPALLNNFHINDAGFENTINWQNCAYSGESDADLWLSISERRRGYSASSFTHTGTVAKTVILTPWTVPAGFFIAATANTSLKKIRVVVVGEFVTAAALSKIGVDLGGTVVDQATAVAPAANSTFRYEVEIWADGNAAQYRVSTLQQNGAVAIVARGTSTQNMVTAARAVQITAQLANAGDSLKIDRTEVWVSG